MQIARHRITEIEENPSIVAGATKECFECDVDNPRAVPRAACKSCGGAGREKLAVLEIVEEITGQKKSTGSEDDENLYLEY